jgi:hypothetical protein
VAHAKRTFLEIDSRSRTGLDLRHEILKTIKEISADFAGAYAAQLCWLEKPVVWLRCRKDPGTRSMSHPDCTLRKKASYEQNQRSIADPAHRGRLVASCFWPVVHPGHMDASPFLWSSKRAAGKGARRAHLSNRYVTDRAAAGLDPHAQIVALRSRLEKQPTELRAVRQYTISCGQRRLG